MLTLMLLSLSITVFSSSLLLINLPYLYSASSFYLVALQPKI